MGEGCGGLSAVVGERRPMGGNPVKSFFLNGKLVWDAQKPAAAMQVKDGYLWVSDLMPGKYEYKVIYAAFHEPKPVVEKVLYYLTGLKMGSIGSNYLATSLPSY